MTDDRVLVMDERGSVLRTTNTERSVARNVGAPTDKVFSAATAAYGVLEIPVTTAITATGQVGSSEWVFPRRFQNLPASRYFDCGSSMTGLIADQARITVRLLTDVKPASATDRSASSVSTIVTAAARLMSGASGSETLFCASTGLLEQRIHDRIAEVAK